jgi:hypothetical protein
VRVDDEDVAATRGHAPDFVAFGVFAEVGNIGPDRNFANGCEFGEIHDGERAVGGGDVGAHVEIGTEEGRTMFTEDDDSSGDEKKDEGDVDARAFGMGHCVKLRIAEVTNGKRREQQKK